MTRGRATDPRAASGPRQLLESLAPGPARPAPPGMPALRERAAGRFLELGIPSPRHEAWKHTDVRGLADLRLRPCGPAGAEAGGLPLPESVFDGACLLGPDGTPRPGGVELPQGVTVQWLSRLSETEAAARVRRLEGSEHLADHPFFWLNTACAPDVLWISVAPGVQVPAALVLLQTVRAEPGGASLPRVWVEVGDGAECSLVELYASDDGLDLCVPVTQIRVGENARLDHVRLQWEDPGARHLGIVEVELDRAARYVSHNVHWGARLARVDLVGRLLGEGAEATLNGLYVTGSGQHVDNHTLLDHAVPHCPSHELYKGVLTGDGQAVFNGRIIVRPGAQKTDAKQSNKNLLLSRDALVHTRPQLEIYASDVRCTHGATIGHLEEEAMFYLRSRGLDLHEARSLLIRGFANDLLDRIPFTHLREALEARVLERVLRELRRDEAHGRSAA